MADIKKHELPKNQVHKNAMQYYKSEKRYNMIFKKTQSFFQFFLTIFVSV